MWKIIKIKTIVYIFPIMQNILVTWLLRSEFPIKGHALPLFILTARLALGTAVFSAVPRTQRYWSSRYMHVIFVCYHTLLCTFSHVPEKPHILYKHLFDFYSVDFLLPLKCIWLHSLDVFFTTIPGVFFFFGVFLRNIYRAVLFLPFWFHVLEISCPPPNSTSTTNFNVHKWYFLTVLCVIFKSFWVRSITKKKWSSGCGV